jgi:hypothetical protein
VVPRIFDDYVASGYWISVGAEQQLIRITASHQVGSLAWRAIVVAELVQGAIGRPAVRVDGRAGAHVGGNEPHQIRAGGVPYDLHPQSARPAPGTSTATATSSLSPRKRPSRPA